SSDLSTANEPGRTYGTFDYGVDITNKTTTVLPFTIWMPLLDMQHATPLPAPTPHEIVARSPRIPGLEVHVPAGVILQTDEGPLPLISLTQIPVDRSPYPLPPGTTFFFTPQGHGAQVLRTDGTPSPAGVRVVLPNVDQLPPATRLELTHYSYYRGGWTTYREGAVHAHGRRIALTTTRAESYLIPATPAAAGPRTARAPSAPMAARSFPTPASSSSAWDA